MAACRWLARNNDNGCQATTAMARTGTSLFLGFLRSTGIVLVLLLICLTTHTRSNISPTPTTPPVGHRLSALITGTCSGGGGGYHSGKGTTVSTSDTHGSRSRPSAGYWHYDRHGDEYGRAGGANTMQPSSSLAVFADAFRVLSPLSMIGDIPVSLASFGPPHLALEEQDWEAEVILAEPFDGCTDFTNEDKFANKIVFVRRGGPATGCTFRAKVRACERVGAIGVVIVNYPLRELKRLAGSTGGDMFTAEGGPPLFQPRHPPGSIEEERSYLFMMADDGKGGPVKIPVEMMTHTEGMQLVHNGQRKGKRVVGSMGHPIVPSDYRTF